MTSRESIMLTLNHEIPDRVPICPRMSAYLWETYGRKPGIDEYLDFKKNCFEFDLFFDTQPFPPEFIYTQTEDHSILPGVEVELTKTVQDRKTYIRRKIKTPKGPLEDTMIYPPSGDEYGLCPV